MRLKEITAFGDTERKWIDLDAPQKSPSELRDAVRRIRDGGWIQTGLRPAVLAARPAA